MLFSKSNNYFPEIELSIKSSSLSSGCFLLIILLRIDYIIFAFFFIEIRILSYNFWRRGKSNFFSMFSILNFSSRVLIIKVYNFFQFAIEKYSNCLKELSLESNLIFIYIEIVSDFNILFLKYIQLLFSLLNNQKNSDIPKQAFHIWKKVQHIHYQNQHYLN